MIDKLEAIKERFDEVSQLIVDPEIISDMKQYIKLNKEYKDLQPIMEAHKAYKNILSNIETAKEMLKDDEMREMAKIEIDELQPQQEGAPQASCRYEFRDTGQRASPPCKCEVFGIAGPEHERQKTSRHSYP